ncbi:MAG: SWIM zinc finger family protein [Myxococcales bacterium]
MPRFERLDDRRFWEIHTDADGKTVHTRAGILGSDGRPSKRKTWPTKKAAAEEVKARTEEQLAKGYVQLPSWEEPAPREMLELIAADPTSPGGYQVYADWLQQKRHPRGELIMLQVTRAARPDDAKLLKAEEALLEKHAKLAPPRCTEASKKTRRKMPEWAKSELRWEHGFVASARLAHFFADQPWTIRELVTELLEHPAGRFLRSLELGIRGDVDGVVSYVDVLDDLARLAPPSLRSLSVVEAPAGTAKLAFSELGPLDHVLAAMPGLESLRLAGQKMSFGDREMPGLKRLSVATSDPSVLASLVSGHLPALESLELDCGEAALDPATIAPLLGGERVPKLRRLALARTAQTDALVLPLAKAPLLARLEKLSLAGGHLSDQGAASLIAQREAFAHLATLDVSGNEVHEKLEALGAVCPKVVVASQRAKTAVALSDSDLTRLSKDSATLAKARDLAKPSAWAGLGREAGSYWGRCKGSSVYDVTFSPATSDTTCTCPAAGFRERACKHAVALAMLVAAGVEFSEKPRPAGFGESAW